MTDQSNALRIRIVSPAAADSQSGNGVTARRWAGIMRQLGHDAQIASDAGDCGFDVLVALHARKSATAIATFRERHPARPIILALTGTDVYGEIERDTASLESLEAADKLVVLQPDALDHLPQGLRDRAHVIRQSVTVSTRRHDPPSDRFQVLVIAHLRDVKDPMLAATASRLLPAESRIVVRHYGAALDNGLSEQALKESRENPRYEWLGERPRDEVLSQLARSHVLALTSKSEGGANVVSEAIVLGVPVLSTQIGGSIGMLGPDYEGYFSVGDADGLATKMRLAETDREYLGRLQQRVESLQSLYEPAQEADAWRVILRQCGKSSKASPRG